jgi:tRNA nucleotidyltransferase/poly(A) polymerase
VITVLGPKPAGTIEVTTFRRDAEYSDGRHPDNVTFSSAKEDASRRDFTINGMFYDPIQHQTVDFVGGRKDLQRRLIRAIGRPWERFAEDKLRMLRAVRFAATFDFRLEANTLEAMCGMAHQITAVSPERIATELRLMLVDTNRAPAVRMMLETSLAAAVLPEVLPASKAASVRLECALAVLGQLSRPGFPLALGALLHNLVDPHTARKICRRWRLSNSETDRVVWLVKHYDTLSDAQSSRWSVLQPILVADGIEDLMALHEVAAPTGPNDVDYCRSRLNQPQEVLDPPPLLTGDDLLEHGIPSGPKYRVLLQRARDGQLDGEIQSKAEALALVDRLLGE